jgi:ABC-type multidrug transport system fused ATPase/permease subunit
MNQFLTKILYITKGSHKSLLAMMFLFLFISLLEVVGTGIIGPFIAIALAPDLVKTNYWLDLIYKQLNFSSDQQFLIFLGSFVIVLFFVKAFFAFNAQKTVFTFSNNLKADLSCKLLKAYIEAPYSFHLHVNSATLIQNLTNTTDSVSIGVMSTLLTFISNSVIVLALMLLLIKTSAIALILIAILLFISFALLHPTKDLLARWSEDAYKSYGEMIRVTNHGLGGLKETRIIGCESYFENQMEEQAKIFAKNSTLASAYGNLPRFVLEPLMISFLIGFTFLFVILNQGASQNLAGVLGVFALATVRLLPAVGGLISGINVIRTNSYSLDKLFFDLKELEKEKFITEFKPTSHPNILLTSQDIQTFPFSERIGLDSLTFQCTRRNLSNYSQRRIDRINWKIWRW